MSSALDEAAPLLREALTACRETLGARHPQTLVSICSLGALLQVQGDVAGARRLYEEAVSTGREVLGEGHPHVQGYLSNLHALG